MTEEITHLNESPAKKINTPDEDHHFINDHLFQLHPHLPAADAATGLYKEMLPSSHADDIETPPPNIAIS